MFFKCESRFGYKVLATIASGLALIFAQFMTQNQLIEASPLFSKIIIVELLIIIAIIILNQLSKAIEIRDTTFIVTQLGSNTSYDLKMIKGYQKFCNDHKIGSPTTYNIVDHDENVIFCFTTFFGKSCYSNEAALMKWLSKLSQIDTGPFGILKIKMKPRQLVFYVFLFSIPLQLIFLELTKQ